MENVLQQVTAEKSEELDTRVQELKLEYADQLESELKLQQELHQRLLEEEGAKLEAELAAQHVVQLEAKLAEQQAGRPN